MMIKPEHKAIVDTGNFIYWEDFFRDRRGNPWTVRPTFAMWSDYGIYYMSKKDALTGAIEHGEVFFDKRYVDAWKLKMLEGLEFLLPDSAHEPRGGAVFDEFESRYDIVVSVKNHGTHFT